MLTNSNQIQTNTNESGSNPITSNDVNKHNDTSSTILSRADLKNKEIEQIINSPGSKNYSMTNSITSETSETKSKINKKSKKVNNVENSDSKTSIEKILSSPPAIRRKAHERLTDIFELSKKVGGGNVKKNIKVTRGKNNLLSEKFDQAESFYDTMIKL